MPTGSVNHTFTASAAGGSSPIGPLQWTSNGDAGTDINVVVPASAVNQAYPIAIDVSNLKSVFLVADGVITIKVNSTGSPVSGSPWASVANVPVMDWTDEMTGQENPLSVDVTVLYLTNGTGSDITLRGLVNQLV